MPDLMQIVTVVGFGLMGLMAATMVSLGLAALWTWRDWPGADWLTDLAARLAILQWAVGGCVLIAGGLFVLGLAFWMTFLSAKPLPGTWAGLAGYVAMRLFMLVFAGFVIFKGWSVLAAWRGAQKETGAAPDAGPGATARKE